MQLDQNSIDTLKDSVKKAMEMKKLSPTNELALNITGHSADACQLLRINEVKLLTTLSKSTISLWVAQGRFPKPIALSSTVKVWRVSDIQKWSDAHFCSLSDINIDTKGEQA